MVEDGEGKLQRFSSLEEFKKQAEFFPAGKIIPQRILKGPRRIKHLCNFSYDSYAVRTNGGYIVLCVNDGPSKASKLNRSTAAGLNYPIGGRLFGKNRVVVFYGSPYTPGGVTHWLFEHKIVPGPDLSGQRVAREESEVLDAINKIAK